MKVVVSPPTRVSTVDLFLFTLLLIAGTDLDYGNGDVLIRLSLHISMLSPFGLEPASVATATNGLKGYFPLKDKPQWGVGGAGRKRLQLPVTPQVNPGSMHRLFVWECVCVCVCACVCVCVEILLKVCVCVCVWVRVLWGQMLNCTASQWEKKKSFLQTVHMFGMLIYIFIWACLEVLTEGKFIVHGKRFSSCFKKEKKELAMKSRPRHKHTAVKLSSFHPVG